MKKITFLLFLFISTLSFSQSGSDGFLIYEIDLTGYQDDLFHVTLHPGKLTAEDNYYNFAAFTPGVHQVLDYGRFVKSFNAFDKNGRAIETEQESTNRWLISDPVNVFRIEYTTEDSFDALLEDHPIYPMSGTGIEEDFIILNSFGVFGYFDNHKSKPTQIKIDYNPDWIIGTPLDKNEDGYYYAESYHHLTDSPILMGELTTASKMIGDINVEVYSYSPIDEINSPDILKAAEPILNAAVEFVDFAPVNRYCFLMYFLDEEMYKRNGLRGGGALEHSYSSTYALPAQPEMTGMIKDVIAHEFMHILTPLNLHSEVLADFNYSIPASKDVHIWLYEGITEWVSEIMQFRSGLITMDNYLSRLSDKINDASGYNPEYSLTRISTEWFTDEGNRQYGNVYQLGALTAAMLDIRLLELSGGTRGLREIYLELINKYGKDKPFQNDTFFDEFVKMTYPEIDDFIKKHIKGTAPLPWKEYFTNIGIEYIPERTAANKPPIFGLGLGQSSDGVHPAITSFSKTHENFGLQVGDIVLEVFGMELSNKTYGKMGEIKSKMKPGDEYEIKVKRGSEEISYTGTVFQAIERHVLKADENASQESIRLRNIWSRYL